MLNIDSECQHRDEKISIANDQESEVRPVRAAYGRCGVPGCPCQGFQGGGMACNNCGHQYGQHLG